MNRHSARIAAAAALAALAAAPAAAQVSLTPRALGMGGAYVAAARGNETLFLNPANLGLADTPHWSLAFPQVAVGTDILGPGFEDLPDLVEFDNIDDARRDEILASVPASGTELRYDVRAPLAALQVGHFAVGVAYGSVGAHSVGKDIVELIFHGYEDGRTDYSVGDTRGSRVTFWDFAAAYGRRFGPVSVGVTGHYVRGGTILNARLFEPRIDVESESIEIAYRSVFARGGQGYGIDFGLAAQPVPSLTLSASVVNAFADMQWSEELYTRSLVLDSRDFDDAEYMVIEPRYEGSETRVDAEAAPLEVLHTAEGLYDRAYFPAVLNAGAAWTGSWGTTLSASYRDQLTEGRLGAEWGTMAGAGIQQKLPLVTLRAGYATNLEEGSMVTGGLSLGVLQFGVAKVDHGEVSGAPRTGWIGTFGIGVRTKGVVGDR